jgi:putative transposase
MNEPVAKRNSGAVATSEKQRRKIAVFQRVKARPETVSVTDWLDKISREYRVSSATVRRWCTEIEAYGVNETKPRNSRGPSAWDSAAIEYLQGVYLKAIREVGECTKRAAYKALCRKAEIEGWKVGSEQSCYQYLKAVHPLLVKYAKGGERALDNFFYINRDLSTLKPFQIVVGDQHTFDFWVRDPDGKLIRPQCYVWLDMGTRLVYGLEFEKQYSSRTVKEALKSGIRRFGTFDCTYNDNGKPELSAAMNDLIQELGIWGMKNSDLAELYHTEKGVYIVEDENGQIIGYAKDRDEWYRFHRRIVANVRNAKAKPIERFFKTLEQLIVDRGCPGKVRDLSASAGEDEEARKRLKQQAESLLTAEEFARLVVTCIDEYESRRHESLGISPRQRLMEWVDQGWKPVMVPEETLEWIFLEKAVRKIVTGRITIGSIQYMGDELSERNGSIDESVGILHYEGRRVEVRYNPEDPEFAYAVIDGAIRPLVKVRCIEMLDAEGLEGEMKRKRGQITSIRTAFRSITEKVDPVVLKTNEPTGLQEAKKKQEEVSGKANRILEGDIEAEVQRRISASKLLPFEKRVFETEGERYKYCLMCVASGKVLREEDRRFVREFEEGLTTAEAMYWQEYRRLLSV